MHISAHLGLPPGHSHFPFVDVTTRSDTRLFLDPCLIERGQVDFGGYLRSLVKHMKSMIPSLDMAQATTGKVKRHMVCGIV